MPQSFCLAQRISQDFKNDCRGTDLLSRARVCKYLETRVHMTVYPKWFRERRRIEREALFSVSHGRMYHFLFLITSYSRGKDGSGGEGEGGE
jgi:hypothetical protein